MAEIPGKTGGSASSPHNEAIAERVRHRLDIVGRALDRRAKASRPKTRRRKASGLLESGKPATGDASHDRERAALRAVFHEFGDAHRQYRARTGHSVTPALRAATTAFKQEPSLLSLVPVAAFLDELGILAW